MNKIILIGRVLKDVWIRKQKIDGKDQLIASFIVLEIRKNKAGELQKKYYNCICYEKMADTAGLLVRQNSFVYVTGSMDLYNKINREDSSKKSRANRIVVSWLEVYDKNSLEDVPNDDISYWQASNYAIVSGRIKDNIKLQKSPSGLPWASFLLESVRDTEGGAIWTNTIRAIAFGKSAYYLYHNYNKGDDMIVNGTAHLNVYQTPDGITQEGWEIIVEHAEKLNTHIKATEPDKRKLGNSLTKQANDETLN